MYYVMQSMTRTSQQVRRGVLESRSDTDKRENNMEIDFLIRQKRKICPVEVKSGTYRKHSSLDKFRNKFNGKIGQPYILYTKYILIKENVIHLSIYMAMFL